MRYVYLHVALLWAGSLGLITVAVLGIITCFKPLVKIGALVHFGWLALIALAGSTFFSGIAAIKAWGGISWSEPVNQAALTIILVTLLVQLVVSALRHWRFTPLLYALPVITMLVTLYDLPKVMHPENPITLSDTFAIPLTFITLTTIFYGAMLAVSFVPSTLINDDNIS
ncbi:MAG: hypothetical protein ACE5EH_11355 [Gammaproteobacteria bacterium]